jgi:hypothetical protein
MRTVEEQLGAASYSVELMTPVELEAWLRIPTSPTANRASRDRGFQRHISRSPDLDLASTVVLIDPLNNWRKHGEDRRGAAREWRVDPFSTGWLFNGWRERSNEPFVRKTRDTYDPIPVYGPQTWLLKTGWHRHGLISLYEVPGRPADARVS